VTASMLAHKIRRAEKELDSIFAETRVSRRETREALERVRNHAVQLIQALGEISE
jgi:hypothetical protein